MQNKKPINENNDKGWAAFLIIVIISAIIVGTLMTLLGVKFL